MQCRLILIWDFSPCAFSRHKNVVLLVPDKVNVITVVIVPYYCPTCDDDHGYDDADDDDLSYDENYDNDDVNNDFMACRPPRCAD